MRAPVLVIGAEMDGIISVAEVQRTARAYGVEPLIVPGMGHTMMLEEGWQERGGPGRRLGPTDRLGLALLGDIVRYANAG